MECIQINKKSAKQQRKTYLVHFSDLARQSSISDEDSGADVDSLWQGFVRASNLLGVTLDGVVNADLELLTCNDIDWFVIS